MTSDQHVALSFTCLSGDASSAISLVHSGNYVGATLGDMGRAQEACAAMERGFALGQTAQFAEAVKWQQQALELPGLSGEAKAGAEQRLRLYRDGKPYRTP